MSTRPMLPVRVVRYAFNRSRDFRYYLRGKSILRSYSSHYDRARRNYSSNAGDPLTRDPAAVGVQVIPPGSRDQLLALDPLHVARVDRVATSVGRALDDPSRCRFIPGVRTRPLPPRTSEIPEVISGEIITAQLLDPFALDGVEELAEPLMRTMEDRIYGSHVVVDKVYVYRTLISRSAAVTSWLWHFDNHPREMLKLMKQHFETVRHVKPSASREDSAELFVLALGFRQVG